MAAFASHIVDQRRRPRQAGATENFFPWPTPFGSARGAAVHASPRPPASSLPSWPARTTPSWARRAIANARLYAESRQRHREAELVGQLAEWINASLDLQTTLERLVEGTRDLCAGDI